MNEIKIFFLGFFIGILFSVAFAIIFRLFRRRTDSDVGTRIEQAGTTCEHAKGTIEQLAGTTECANRIEQNITRTNDKLAESIDTSQSILGELKKRQYN